MCPCVLLSNFVSFNTGSTEKKEQFDSFFLSNHRSKSVSSLFVILRKSASLKHPFRGISYKKACHSDCFCWKMYFPRNDISGISSQHFIRAGRYGLEITLRYFSGCIRVHNMTLQQNKTSWYFWPYTSVSILTQYCQDGCNRIFYETFPVQINEKPLTHLDESYF